MLDHAATLTLLLLVNGTRLPVVECGAVVIGGGAVVPSTSASFTCDVSHSMTPLKDEYCTCMLYIMPISIAVLT